MFSRIGGLLRPTNVRSVGRIAVFAARACRPPDPRGENEAVCGCNTQQSNTQLLSFTTDRFRTDRLPHWAGTDAALAALKTSRSGMRAKKLSTQPGINPLGTRPASGGGETAETATPRAVRPNICPTCPVPRYALTLPASAMTYHPSSSRPGLCWSRSLLGMALLDACETGSEHSGPEQIVGPI